MADRPWKRAERAIARRLGGTRVPVSGRAGQPDVAHPRLAIEVKHRRALPQWLKRAMSQACRAAGPAQTPLVVVHEHGQPHGNDLVVLRFADFERLAQPGRD